MGFEDSLRLGRDIPSKHIEPPKVQRTDRNTHLDGTPCILGNDEAIDDIANKVEIPIFGQKRIIRAYTDRKIFVADLMVKVCCSAVRKQLEKILLLRKQ
jgi:hypothetical protein